MTRFALSFTPLVPVALLWVLGLAAVVIVVLGVLGRRRGTALRALGLALFLLALADPTSCARTGTARRTSSPWCSTTAAARPSASAPPRPRRPAPPSPSNSRGSATSSRASSIRAAPTPRTTAPAFSVPCRTVSPTCRPERVAGAILVTDGVVHDIPADAAALGFKAPLQVLVTGHAGERDRRVELIEAPRFGIVGKDQTISLRVLDTDDHGEPVAVTVRRDGVEWRSGRRASAPASTCRAGSTMPDRTSSRSTCRPSRAS